MTLENIGLLDGPKRNPNRKPFKKQKKAENCGESAALRGSCSHALHLNRPSTALLMLFKRLQTIPLFSEGFTYVFHPY